MPIVFVLEEQNIYQLQRWALAVLCAVFWYYCKWFFFSQYNIPQLLEKYKIQNTESRGENRAGHFRYFLIFSILKNDFFAFFMKLITYFCTSPI